MTNMTNAHTVHCILYTIFIYIYSQVISYELMVETPLELIPVASIEMSHGHGIDAEVSWPQNQPCAGVATSNWRWLMAFCPLLMLGWLCRPRKALALGSVEKVGSRSPASQVAHDRFVIAMDRGYAPGPDD